MTATPAALTGCPNPAPPGEGENAVAAALAEDIPCEGSASFTRFMETALYHPTAGYYARGGRSVLGKTGDFFTSVSVGACFGQLVALQIHEMWQRLGAPPQFAIVESGAHDGRLAADILGALRGEFPALFHAVRYRIREPLPLREQEQRKTLADFGPNVIWEARDGMTANAGALPPGVVLANELLDAFPVCRVKWDGRRWLECAVAGQPGAFHWVDRPLAPDLAAECARIFPENPPAPGFVSEFAPGVGEWMQNAARQISRGFMLLIDYGMRRRDYYDSSRPLGTLRGYRRHRQVQDVLETPGQIDLTAHVDWDRVQEAAAQSGLAVCGWCDQGQFLTALAAPRLQEIERSAPPDESAAAWLRQLQTLIHPGQMGRAFQVMILSRNVGPQAPLTGLKFARPFENA